ncbi:hypothetical protein BKA70DRAFT_193440 [Coprinopsis sp. MPI-PUGE-AT-0042]|nr:hypothetical protein BKA70DRAFT_193440 [Coprinopsis sp. MPI-PUGE-AT-0042]
MGRLDGCIQAIGSIIPFHVFTPSSHLLTRIPLHLLSLPIHITPPTLGKYMPDPSPIIPLLTSRPRSLSALVLCKHGINARPITWPTVTKGKDRVRICSHAGNAREEVDLLVRAVVEWAEEEVQKEAEEVPRMGRVDPNLGGRAGERQQRSRVAGCSGML